VAVPVDPPIDNLTPFQAEIFALNLINGDRRLTEHLVHTGSCDTSYFLPGRARFRVNIFSQRGNYSMVLRKLETSIPTIEALKLPDAFKKMPAEKNGLILITGATGSGKTTSLAALLNEINATKSVHVVTLEDPVEYVHPNRKSTSTSASSASTSTPSPTACGRPCARRPRSSWSVRCGTARPPSSP
jgi:twitching motility protein PilT